MQRQQRSVSREPGTSPRCLDADLQNSDRERRRERGLSANSERVSANSDLRTANSEQRHSHSKGALPLSLVRWDRQYVTPTATYGPHVCARAYSRGTARTSRDDVTPSSSSFSFGVISRQRLHIADPSIPYDNVVQRADGLRDDTNAVLALEGRATRDHDQT
jgi:hypothetical protein